MFSTLSYRMCRSCISSKRFFNNRHRTTLNSSWNGYKKIQFLSTSTRKMDKNSFTFTDYDLIGFDLDNTIARFRVGNMIEMEYKIISKFLVNKGYSKEYLIKPFDHNFIIKGLIVDDENGNLLRIAGDGLILQATHGSKWLTADEIKKYYPDRHWEPTDIFSKDPLQTWNGPHSEMMRTLLDYFDIVISLVFARAVDSIDANLSLDQKVYKIWPDIQEAAWYMFDRKHFQLRKGEYFVEMMKNPEKYYYKCSDNLKTWIRDLRRLGKRLVLVSGSNVDFASHTATNTIGPEWREYFDVVVCYAKKPGFFTQRRDFIGWDGLNDTGIVSAENLQVGGVYTFGNWLDLKNFISSKMNKKDPKCLYVGDNLIQDIYTPNVHSRLDTVAVCEELEAERVHGHTENWHPDEQFLCSTVWGSYFHCKDSNMETNWYQIMKKHAKLCVPSLEYVSGFPVDYEFKNIIP